MAARILILVLLAILPSACALPSAPTPTSASESATPIVAPPTPTRMGEITIPFTTVDVTTYYVQPTPTFITPPEVERSGRSEYMPDLNIELLPTEPHLYLLTTPDDIEAVAQYLPSETVAAIAASDFATDVILVLLRGVRGSSGFATFIERIGYKDNTLIVYAQLWELAEWSGFTEGSGFPFHVVRIKRADLPVHLNTVSLAVQLEPHKVTPTPPGGLPPQRP